MGGGIAIFKGRFKAPHGGILGREAENRDSEVFC
jgi:hypothetical protein